MQTGGAALYRSREFSGRRRCHHDRPKKIGNRSFAYPLPICRLLQDAHDRGAYEVVGKWLSFGVDIGPHMTGGRASGSRQYRTNRAQPETIGYVHQHLQPGAGYYLSPVLVKKRGFGNVQRQHVIALSQVFRSVEERIGIRGNPGFVHSGHAKETAFGKLLRRNKVS